MKKLGVILNLYQPVVQEEKKLREIAESTYLPLIKIIKNRKDFRPTLNLPLGLLQQMDNCGYSSWISDIKALVEEDKVELLGSAAYNAVLTKLPEPLLSNQIILNEYGLGYFFGRRSGFEGESAVLVKGLKGFYAPENIYKKDVLDLIESLGYSWLLVDPASVGGKTGVLSLQDNECHLLSFNSSISDKLMAKKDMNVDDILSEIQTAEDGAIFLNAEVFGGRNKDGSYLLNKLLDKLTQSEIEIVLSSELVEEQIDESRVGEADNLAESEYAPADPEMWRLNQEFTKSVAKILSEVPKLEVEGMENVAIWGDGLSNEIKIPLYAAEIADVSQFEIPELRNNFLDLYARLAETFEDEKTARSIEALRR